MRIKITIIGAIILTLVGGFLYDYFAIPATMPLDNQTTRSYEKLPPMTMTQFDGANLDIHQLKEPIILLSFWASWCTTCVKEMPDILQLVQKMNGNVAFVTVSIDDSQEDAEKIRQKMPNTPHVYWVWDKNKQISLNQFNVIKTPETIVINKNRQMVQKIVGEYDWSGSEIQNILNSL